MRSPLLSRPQNLRRGVLGLYALALMEKEGAVHGYRVSKGVAERTEGAWRPGPGAVYPALQKLVQRGLARPRLPPRAPAVVRRREFQITPQGRALLQRIRARGAGGHRMNLDLAPLWAEVVGLRSMDELMLLRLRRTLQGISERLDRAEGPGREGEKLRGQVEQELRRYLAGTKMVARPGARPASLARTPSRGGRT